MRTDLVLEARAFLPSGFQDVEIGLDLDQGRIHAVKRSLPGTPRKRFRGKLLFPSGVDLHVHFRDPGDARKEDFKTGTRGAARGGIGTVLDMPNTKPVVDRLGRLEEKRDRVAGRACVDWGLWTTLTPDTPDAPRLARRAAGIKFYLSPTTGIEAPPNREELRRWLGVAAKADRVVAVHAERVGPRPPRSLAEHDASRPARDEAECVHSLSPLAPAGARVHVAHASDPATLEAARTAGFSAALTPHHLLLAFDEGNLGGRGKVNPPLRSARDRRALWDAFAAGRAPVLESDHAPHTLEEKSRPFPEVPAGVPGVETGFPLLLTQARRNHVDVDLVARAYAQTPADLLGLPKGRIEAGYDADLFVLDPRRTSKIRGSELASPVAWTPFEGWEIHPVETHFLRGEMVVEDCEFIGAPGRGRGVQVGPARTVLAS